MENFIDKSPLTVKVVFGVRQLLPVVSLQGLFDGTIGDKALLFVSKTVGLGTGSAIATLEFSSVPFD